MDDAIGDFGSPVSDSIDHPLDISKRPPWVALRLLVALLLTCAAVSAYLILFSQASKVARDLPGGATAADVAARAGATVYGSKVTGDVFTCYYRFKDYSVLRCAFLVREDTERYSSLEMKTEMVGTSRKRYQDGVIVGPLWDIPTYDYIEVPNYGSVLKPVEKTRVNRVWVLGKTQVVPFFEFTRDRNPAPLPNGPGSSGGSLTVPSTAGAAPAPPSSSAVAPSPTKSSLGVDFSRGHIPQPGTDERKALMEAARLRLKTESVFVVNAIVASGASAVADLTPESRGGRILIEFNRSTDGKWIAVSDSPCSEDGFQLSTGMTPDSEVTGEF